ncbi:MAG: hypothetical protein M5U14_04040 [Acidimicrobiia bacterium]|nr:hypothetical protein [Acidimicrobiia bacterium]
MSFELLPALVAGVVATLAMTAGFAVMRATGRTTIDFPLILGTMVTGDATRARAAGFVTHVLVMGGLAFGSLYAGLFDWVGAEGSETWLYGVAFGSLHGGIAGFGLAALPAVHPRMRANAGEEWPDTTVFRESPEPVPPTDKPVRGEPRGSLVAPERPQLTLRAPGPFGAEYGSMTPIGLVLGHLAYGLVFGGLYGTLA